MDGKVVITCVQGSQRGQSWEFSNGGFILVGRDNPDAQIRTANVGDEKSVSHNELIFRFDDRSGRIYAGTHWKSRYGTLLNGEKLPHRLDRNNYQNAALLEENGWYLLQSGDEITIGNFEGKIKFQVSCPESSFLSEIDMKSKIKSAMMKNMIDPKMLRDSVLQIDGSEVQKFCMDDCRPVKGFRPVHHEFYQVMEQELKSGPELLSNCMFTMNMMSQPAGFEVTVPEETETIGMRNKVGSNHIELEFESSEEKAVISRRKDPDGKNSGKKDYHKVQLTNFHQIGTGGFSRVFLAEDARDGEKLVVKSMDMVETLSEQKKKQILREADLGMRLDHPNLVKTYDIFEKYDVYHIVMEYCDLNSVAELMEEPEFRNGMDLEEATEIILQALDGLEYMHNVEIEQPDAEGHVHEVTGVVHRDLKPENLLLKNENGRRVLKITDFGLAKAYELSGMSGLTINGSSGTPAFISTRQMLDYLFPSPYVDIFSIAATYYTLLTGETIRPFERVYKQRDKENLIINSVKVPILERNPRIPAKLAKVIDSVLEEEKYPSDYDFTTAAEFKKQIRQALDMD